MTPAQIAAFERDGCLVIEDVVPARLRARIEAECAGALDEHFGGRLGPGGLFDRIDAARASGLEWFQPLDISLPADGITEETPFHFGPAVFDLVTLPAILDIAEALLGPELTSNPIQHVRIKPPTAEVDPGEIRAHIAPTAWHQDRGVGHEEADGSDILTVWIAMTDATPENGCLRAVPKERDMLPHCPRSQTTIADGHLDESAARDLPVRAGGIVLLHPLTPHSAGPNVTGGYRWSFDIRYNVTGQPTGRAHFPDFVARSRSAPETELRDWRAWRAMWEAARTRAARAPHIPQHRWEASSPACA